MSDFNWHGPVTIRKARVCMWCGQGIEKGERAMRHFGKWEGDTYSGVMHKECHNAWDTAPDGMLCDGWEFHSFRRGTHESLL
jgi:hypothetical protein